MQRRVADVCAGPQLVALPCTFGREFKPHARAWVVTQEKDSNDKQKRTARKRTKEGESESTGMESNATRTQDRNIIIRGAGNYFYVFSFLQF